MPTSLRTGVDVMITNFGKNKGVFLKKNIYMVKILHNLALFWVKNANFLPIFLAKIFLKSYHRSLEYLQKKLGRNLQLIHILW
jgi:hypothetical protein